MGDHIQTSKLRKLGHKHPQQVFPAFRVQGSNVHLGCLDLLEFLPPYNKQTYCCAKMGGRVEMGSIKGKGEVRDFWAWYWPPAQPVGGRDSSFPTFQPFQWYSPCLEIANEGLGRGHGWSPA